jgi:nicotinamidase-related amidase
MKTLVVVDMQPYFINSILDMWDQDKEVPMLKRVKENLVHNTALAVKEWKTRDWPIVLVQYKNRGATHLTIRGEVKGYNKAFKLIKESDNGGEELVKLVRSKGLPRDAVFCGVNLDCCVHDTCHTYHMFEPDKYVAVLDDCTRNVWDWELPKVSMKGWNKSIQLISLKSLVGVKPKRIPHLSAWYKGTGRLKGAIKVT